MSQYKDITKYTRINIFHTCCSSCQRKEFVRQSYKMKSGDVRYATVYYCPHPCVLSAPTLDCPFYVGQLSMFHG